MGESKAVAELNRGQEVGIMKIRDTKFDYRQKVWSITNEHSFGKPCLTCGERLALSYTWQINGNRPQEVNHIEIHADTEVNISYMLVHRSGEYAEDDLFLSKSDAQAECDSRNAQ